MYKTSSNFRISYFHNRILAWIMLTVFCFSFMPSVSLAQQPTATISALSGDVLVSGQAATVGTALRAGDTIQTQAGASAVLELSDGSEIQLGEKTQINIDDLTQTGTGARVSSIKLLAGWLRAFLSSEHQQEGSSFTIETPNAQLGVKFSEPDIEVSYNPESVETVGIAHTVELMAKNLLTDEEVLVPVGSTVIIVGTTIKIVAGILAIAGATEAGTAGAGATEAATTGTGTTSTGTSSTGSSGMGTGTKVALGLGAVAVAAGGVVALAGASSSDSDNTYFIDIGGLSQGQNTEAFYVSEGTICEMQMSHGFYSLEEANSALSALVFELTINNTLLQPKNPLTIRQGGGEWPAVIYQDYTTDKLQKGSYQVIGQAYNGSSNQYWWGGYTVEFTIQVD